MTAQIIPPRDALEADWLALRAELWPAVTRAEHLHDMADALARGHCVRLAVTVDAQAVGFVEASRRVDYVNGTASSPVGFLEGLYVAPRWRRQGIARALVDAVIGWASAQGCTELASDSLLENEAAHAVHRALGFEETERVVYFRRTLPQRPAHVTLTHPTGYAR